MITGADAQPVRSKDFYAERDRARALVLRRFARQRTSVADDLTALLHRISQREQPATSQRATLPQAA